MKRLISFCLLALLSLGTPACYTYTAPVTHSVYIPPHSVGNPIPFTPSVDLHAKTIIIVRHANRDRDPSHHNGDKELDPLTGPGWQRAHDLAALVAHYHVTRIIATDAIRTQETASIVQADLAQSGHPAFLDFTSLKHSTATAALAIAALQSAKPGEVVLLVYHHELIPGLLKALNCPQTTPINEEEYDRLYILAQRYVSEPQEQHTRWFLSLQSYGQPFKQ